MENSEDRKNLRRTNLRTKKFDNNRDELERYESKKKIKSYKLEQRQNYEDEEWEEWKELYS